jgi:hypothetical protein
MPSDFTRESAEPAKKSFTLGEAKDIARNLGIDFKKAGFDAEQFRMGLDTELEHGRRNTLTNVSNDDPIITGKIALAHLLEFPDYYTRLARMEENANAYWRR